MTSPTREKARQAQIDHFAEHPDLGSEEVQTTTLALYDAVDALTPESRDLLVRECLERLMYLVETVDDPTVNMTGKVLTAVAGYSIQTNREDRGQTSTGDSTVEAIFDHVKATMFAQMKTLIGKDKADAMEAAANRVKARVAAGEDFEKVADEEARRIGIQPDSAPTTPEPVKADDTSTGLYL